MITIIIAPDLHHQKIDSAGQTWRTINKTKNVMISVTGNLIGRYILQPSLINMHQDSLTWLSALLLWKEELAFYQRLLDRTPPKPLTEAEKNEANHLRSLIEIFGSREIDGFRQKIRVHESHLAQMLREQKETATHYFKEHENLMTELENFRVQYENTKRDFMGVIDKIL